MVALGRGDIEGWQEADGLLAGGDDKKSCLDEAFCEAQSGRAGFVVGWREVVDFHAEEESGAADFAHEGQTFQGGGELRAPRDRVGEEVFFFDGVEDGIGRGAGQGGSAVGGAVGAGAEEIGECVAHPERTERETTADAFGPADGVRRGIGGACAVPAAPMAGAAESALNFVIKKEQALLVAQCA